MAAIHLKAEDFEAEVLQSAQPVLVDFYAEWCGPCKMMSPVLDAVADELAGQVKICKINVDEAQEIASQFNVMSIPNLLLFKGGQIADQMVGAMPKEKLIQKIKENL
jgi:thioredoxin 1